MPAAALRLPPGARQFPVCATPRHAKDGLGFSLCVPARPASRACATQHASQPVESPNPNRTYCEVRGRQLAKQGLVVGQCQFQDQVAAQHTRTHAQAGRQAGTLSLAAPPCVFLWPVASQSGQGLTLMAAVCRLDGLWRPAIENSDLDLSITTCFLSASPSPPHLAPLSLVRTTIVLGLSLRCSFAPTTRASNNAERAAPAFLDAHLPLSQLCRRRATQNPGRRATAATTSLHLTPVRTATTAKTKDDTHDDGDRGRRRRHSAAYTHARLFRLRPSYPSITFSFPLPIITLN